MDSLAQAITRTAIIALTCFLIWFTKEISWLCILLSLWFTRNPRPPKQGIQDQLASIQDQLNTLKRD